MTMTQLYEDYAIIFHEEDDAIIFHKEDDAIILHKEDDAIVVQALVLGDTS